MDLEQAVNKVMPMKDLELANALSRIPKALSRRADIMMMDYAYDREFCESVGLNYSALSLKDLVRIKVIAAYQYGILR